MSKKLQHFSEDQLIDRYHRKGDMDALGIVLEQYTTILFGVAMKYLKSESLAQDAVQQTFIKAIEKLPSHITNFGGWLYQVIRNECYDVLRKQSDIGYEEKLSADISAETDKDFEQIERNEQALLQHLPELKEEQKVCIELFYLQKKSYFEIEELTGFTNKEVKSYIQNGKRNLKNMLDNNPNFKR